MSGIQALGGYNVRQISPNRYSVAVNNGNLGARVCTGAELEQYGLSIKNNKPTLYDRLVWAEKINKNDSVMEQIDKRFLNMTRLEKIDPSMTRSEKYITSLRNSYATLLNPLTFAENLKQNIQVF